MIESVQTPQVKECKLTDDENMVVEQQQELSQAIDQAAESADQHDDRPESGSTPTPQRKGLEYNWSETRRKMAELERIAQEQQELIKKLQSKDAPEEENLSEDDLLTVGQLKKVNSKRDQETLMALQRQREEVLALRYPDMDQVLSNENLEIFEKQEPELASALLEMRHDPIKMRINAYNMIKKLVKTNDPQKLDKIRAETNAKKPISVQSVGRGSAIGDISSFENGLTPELKQKLYKEMQEAIKRA